MEVPPRYWKFPIKASSSQSKVKFSAKLEVPFPSSKFPIEVCSSIGNFELGMGTSSFAGELGLRLGTTGFDWELPASYGNFQYWGGTSSFERASSIKNN